MNVFAVLLGLVATVSSVASAVPDATRTAANSNKAIVPVRHWHKSYVEVTTVDSSTFYSMRIDGSVAIYQPYAVDANVNGCAAHQKRAGNWCISSGKLYRSRWKVFVMANGWSESLYLNRAGLVCVRPNEPEGREGNCEIKGSFEDTEQFKAELRAGT